MNMLSEVSKAVATTFNERRIVRLSIKCPMHRDLRCIFSSDVCVKYLLLSCGASVFLRNFTFGVSKRDYVLRTCDVCVAYEAYP